MNIMTVKLTVRQIKEYFPYMDDNLSAEYMGAILLGQKTFNVGQGLIQQWEAEKSKRSNK